MNAETKMILVKSIREFRSFEPLKQRVALASLKSRLNVYCDLPTRYTNNYVQACRIFLRIYKNKTL